ncbi:hypothetical protein HMPREF0591_4320 [Mycobacterium parascrofulaceum ATCC BAA-614]|uniref:Uncharacterized protein n=1 Tax=Mycobacterium parascrofulaceum ATCC BAA-614 TaxID=525368 RepID=D5PDS6_9MYCO|nr:hypothetical protein HMPREF0591_4320 [Mycobacterium parascrofulaceum ATCC BAA-614]
MTGSTAAPAGADGGAADGGDDVVDRAGPVARGGGAAAHCTSTRHAVSIPATAAPRRPKGVNCDDSSPLPLPSV